MRKFTMTHADMMEKLGRCPSTHHFHDSDSSLHTRRVMRAVKDMEECYPRPLNTQEMDTSINESPAGYDYRNNQFQLVGYDVCQCFWHWLYLAACSHDWGKHVIREKQLADGEHTNYRRHEAASADILNLLGMVDHPIEIMVRNHGWMRCLKDNVKAKTMLKFKRKLKSGVEAWGSRNTMNLAEKGLWNASRSMTHRELCVMFILLNIADAEGFSPEGRKVRRAECLLLCTALCSVPYEEQGDARAIQYYYELNTQWTVMCVAFFEHLDLARESREENGVLYDESEFEASNLEVNDEWVQNMTSMERVDSSAILSNFFFGGGEDE